LIVLECGGLAPLYYSNSSINTKAAPGRRTPKKLLRIVDPACNL